LSKFQHADEMNQTTTKKPGRVTLGDVAIRAGVSVSTASLVLADKAKERRISADVHQRVLLAAAELDYCPNLLVRSMQRGRTHVLSFFNSFRDRRANDLYMDHLSTAIETVAGHAGYDLLVTCDFSRTPEETYRFLNGGHSDGVLLFAPRPDEPLLPFLTSSRLPIVAINPFGDADLLPGVKDDMRDGMRQIADRLTALGHRRVAAITDRIGWNLEAPQRVAILRALLHERGVAMPEQWVVPANTPEELTAALRSLLAEPEPPTALFCWHDHIGYMLLEQCVTLGIDVPRRLSLIGYDGLRWPTISGQILDSVSVDLDLLASAAVGLLDDLINGREALTQKLISVSLTPGTTLCPAHR
jgi:DNA-binding LacI/PurR family transcriptional regulator